MKRRKRGTGIGIITFIVLTLCGIIAYSKVGLESKKDSLESKKNVLESQISEEEERRVELENLEAYVQTKKYIEDMAREKLGLVYDYEILFKKEE